MWLWRWWLWSWWWGGGRAQATGVEASKVEVVLEGEEPDAFWDLFALG